MSKPHPTRRKTGPSGSRNLLKKASLHTALLIGIFIGCTPTAVAQQETALPEVIVTATRTQKKVETIGASVTIITGEQLRETGQDVPEALRYVPGFAVVQNGGRGSATSVFTRGGESDHNLVLIDGVKVNNSGGFFNFADLTADNIDRIEILRGPQSALYGADAMAAVIQIFTRKGRGAPGAGAYLRGGSDTTIEGGGSFQFGYRNFGFSAAVGGTHTDGFLRVNNQYHNVNVSMMADHKVGKRFRTRLSTRYSDSRFAFPTGGAGDRFDPLDPNQFADTERFVLSPRVEALVLPWWEHVLQIGYNRENRRSADPEDAGIDLFGSSDTNTREERVTADYLWHFGPWEPEPTAVRPTLGFAVEHEIFKSHSISEFLGTPSVSRTELDRTNYAVFTQFQFTFFDRLYLTPGVRFTDNEKFGDSTDPKVTAAYLLRRWGTKLRAGYSEGIKSPSFLQVFGGSGTVGNPNLEPEKSRGFELGIDQNFKGRKIQAGATFFYTRFEDLFAFLGGPGPNFFNIQKVLARGVEATATLHPGYGVTINGSYTFTDTEVVKAGAGAGAVFTPGGQVVRRPKHRGTLRVGYRYKNFNGNISTLLVGDSKDANFSTFPAARVTLKGYERVDLNLSYRLPWTMEVVRAVHLEFFAKNLLDQEYEEAFGFSSPGITALGGLRLEFGPQPKK